LSRIAQRDKILDRQKLAVDAMRIGARRAGIIYVVGRPPNRQAETLKFRCGRDNYRRGQPMEDLKTKLEKLLSEADDCELIGKLAADAKKRELFTRLAADLRSMARDIEDVIAARLSNDKNAVP
jgi:hypothetical protein